MKNEIKVKRTNSGWLAFRGNLKVRVSHVQIINSGFTDNYYEAIFYEEKKENIKHEIETIYTYQEESCIEYAYEVLNKNIAAPLCEDD